MNPAPLTGRHIITTRPAGQESALVNALVDLGASVQNFPVIAIVPADPAPLRDLTLEAYSLAFFVSPNAIAQALSIRPRSEWPASLRVAAVGPASLAALNKEGFEAVLSPARDFDSEGVLALPEFSPEAVTGRRILIVRGDGGRELLADTLRERGAEVTTVSCYRRIRATLDTAPLSSQFHSGKLSALVFSASQGLTFFLEIMGPIGAQMLRELPVFAPHPRICEALRAAGVPTPILTPGGDEGIAKGIARTLGR